MANRRRIWLGLLVSLLWAAYAAAAEVNPPLVTGTLVIAGRVTLTV